MFTCFSWIHIVVALITVLRSALLESIRCKDTSNSVGLMGLSPCKPSNLLNTSLTTTGFNFISFGKAEIIYKKINNLSIWNNLCLLFAYFTFS